MDDGLDDVLEMDRGTTQLQEDFFQMFQETGYEDVSNELGLGHTDPILSLKCGGGSSRVCAVPSMLNHPFGSEEMDPVPGKRRWTDTPADLATCGHSEPPSNKRGRKAPAAPTVAAAPVEKKDKGLRQFSWKLCQKVKEKGRTTYNQLADELVIEFSSGPAVEQQSYDEKNIRRRVYDAFNVLMALGVIAREKKDIRWIGLPGDAEKDLGELRANIQERTERIAQKQTRLEELVLQFVALKNLLRRNQRKEYAQSTKHRVYIPFVVVATSPETGLQINTREEQKVEMSFDRPFTLHHDVDISREMSLYKCSQSDLEKLVPPQLAHFITERRPDILQPPQ